MKEEKKQPKKEECPLCDISEETLKRLREGKNKEAKDQSVKNNEKSGGDSIKKRVLKA